MKVSIAQLYKSMLYFLIICNLSIIKIIPGFNKSVVAYITFAFCLIFTILEFTKKGAINRYYKYYISCIFVFLITEFLFTIIRYDYSIITVFFAAYRYCYLLIAPIVFYVLKKTSYNKFFDFILFATVLSCVIRIITSYYFGLTGKYIFGDLAMEFSSGSWMRNDVLRINLPCLLSIFPAALMNHFNNNIRLRDKIYQLICFLTVEYYVFFILQARAIMVYQILIFILIWLIKRKTPLKQFILYCLLTVAVVFFLNTNIFSVFIESFTRDTNMGGSASHRIMTMLYFFNIFKENVLLGIGFLSDVDLNNGVISGHISDIGILGGIFHFGILGVILYIIVFLRWVNIAFYLYKNKIFGDFYLAFSILLSTLLFGINIDPFYAAVIFSVPIMSGVMEYLFWKNRKANSYNEKILQ